MSTFSGIGTALSGLNAARAGIEVTGQNVANVGVDGYTRQRVNAQSAVTIIGGLNSPTDGTSTGNGVFVKSVERLGNELLDTRVRSALSSNGFHTVQAGALATLEGTLNEPSTDGLAAQLDKFWSAWSDLANSPGDDASGAAVIESAAVLSSQIASGYDSVTSQWLGQRRDLDSMVTQMNDSASRIAELNAQIQHATTSGANVNELIDQRNALTESLASLSGGTVNTLKDGTTEVLIGGNPIVSGTTTHRVRADGGYNIGSPVTLEWSDHPGRPIGLDGGEVAGALTVLAPTSDGGVLAQAAATYNALAVSLHDKVNALHQSAATIDGATGTDFFALGAGEPAKSLSVIPVKGSEIAVAAAGAGSYDGSIADRISQIGNDPNGPDSAWSTFVTTVGVASRSAAQQTAVADSTLTGAKIAQASGAGVDIDEENVNLLMYQTAYQASARVLTTIDEMLSYLINNTGRVGL